MGKETKHIRDHNADTRRYAEPKNTKIKTEYAGLLWENNNLNNVVSLGTK